MLYVITYDISADDVRDDVATVLEGFGRRVQYSVFECRLERDELDTLTERLRAALRSPEHGEIRCYRMCEPCERASFGLGQVEVSETEAALWV